MPTPFTIAIARLKKMANFINQLKIEQNVTINHKQLRGI